MSDGTCPVMRPHAQRARTRGQAEPLLHDGPSSSGLHDKLRPSPECAFLLRAAEVLHHAPPLAALTEVNLKARWFLRKAAHECKQGDVLGPVDLADEELAEAVLGR